MDFISTVEGKEGPAVWLAKRGVTFVALTRVGPLEFPRADEGRILGERADRRADADVQPRAEGALAARRLRGEALGRDGRRLGERRARSTAFRGRARLSNRQMLAATPRVFIEGYRLALEKAIPDRAGARSSCSGACPPEARASIRSRSTTRPTAISAGARARPGSRMSSDRARGGNFNDVYEHSGAAGARARPRRLRVLHQARRCRDTRARWWKAALKIPALQEHRGCVDAIRRRGADRARPAPVAVRTSCRPPDREAGFAAFMQAMFEPSYPPAELKRVAGARLERHQ